MIPVAVVLGIGLVTVAVGAVAYQALTPIVQEFQQIIGVQDVSEVLGDLNDLVEPSHSPDETDSFVPAAQSELLEWGKQEVEPLTNGEADLEIFEVSEPEVFELESGNLTNTSQSVKVQVHNGEVDVDVQGDGEVTQTIERTESGTHVFVEQKVESNNSSSHVTTEVQQSSSTE